MFEFPPKIAEIYADADVDTRERQTEKMILVAIDMYYTYSIHRVSNWINPTKRVAFNTHSIMKRKCKKTPNQESFARDKKMSTSCIFRLHAIQFHCILLFVQMFCLFSQKKLLSNFVEFFLVVVKGFCFILFYLFFFSFAVLF